MLKKLLLIGFLLMVQGATAHAADKNTQAAEFAGYVRETTGTVTVTRAGTTEAKALHVGDDLSIGDKVATGEKSRVRIEFADDSDLVIAQNGKLTIDEYVYDVKRPKEGKAEVTILDAAFAYTSGWMDKGEKSDVKMNLNFGSIGIRGTKLERAMAKGECWIYLEKGAIDVYNQGGKVTLAPGEGTIMSSKAKAPAAPHVWPKKERQWIRAEVGGEHSEWKP